jgi:hypothetical protein
VMVILMMVIMMILGKRDAGGKNRGHSYSRQSFVEVLHESSNRFRCRLDARCNTKYKYIRCN